MNHETNVYKMEPVKRIHDIIHGYIEVSAAALAIIDRPEFGRLRWIKQLGFVNYVYPCANHTRWEHSLGVYWLAKKYAIVLGADPVQAELIAIGGLCHDIGHGPLSHTFERFTNVSHEQRGLEIVDKIFSGIGLIADNYGNQIDFGDHTTVEFIKAVMTGSGIHSSLSWPFEIVSAKSGIDVDKMDYIMRDSYHTTGAFRFEYEQLFHHSHIIDGRIVYDSRQLVNLNTLWYMRYCMFNNVYMHPVCTAFEVMALDMLMHSGWSRDMTIDDYLLLDDSDIRMLIKAGTCEAAVCISNRFIYTLVEGTGKLSSSTDSAWLTYTYNCHGGGRVLVVDNGQVREVTLQAPGFTVNRQYVRY
jgi:hypothetical protein